MAVTFDGSGDWFRSDGAGVAAVVGDAGAASEIGTDGTVVGDVAGDVVAEQPTRSIVPTTKMDNGRPAMTLRLPAGSVGVRDTNDSVEGGQTLRRPCPWPGAEQRPAL
jgi:hypothetical protein